MQLSASSVCWWWRWHRKILAYRYSSISIQEMINILLLWLSTLTRNLTVAFTLLESKDYPLAFHLDQSTCLHHLSISYRLVVSVPSVELVTSDMSRKGEPKLKRPLKHILPQEWSHHSTSQRMSFSLSHWINWRTCRFAGRGDESSKWTTFRLCILYDVWSTHSSWSTRWRQPN